MASVTGNGYYLNQWLNLTNSANITVGSTTSTITWIEQNPPSWTWPVTTNTVSAATPTYIWADWIRQSEVDDNWRAWNARHYLNVAPPPLSPEQAQRAHADLVAGAEAQARVRELARTTAFELLATVLDEDQLRDHRQRQFFEVVAASGRRYRIRTNAGAAGNVRLMVGASGDEEAASFCAHLYSGEPTADSFIAQKLALEDDEEGFLAVANCTPHVAGLVLPRLARTRHLRALPDPERMVA
jgi:hypothetical protein